jgi:hypothetical protein
MQLIYEDKDIAPYVDIRKADIIDNAGGIADSIELHFNDPDGLWSKWKPAKDRKVKIIEEGLSSGDMYIDELEQERGLFIIKALSIKQEAKTDRIRGWDNISFIDFAKDIADKYGYGLKTYNVKNHNYLRVNQFETADFEFLAYRCMLEGYMLKITDNNVVIYDERYMESLAPIKRIDLSDIDGRYRFKLKSTGIYGSCEMNYGEIKKKFVPSGVNGPTLKIRNMYLSSIGEAERYTRGLLRSTNKFEQAGFCTIAYEPGIAAGNTIDIFGIGALDNKYFCDQVIHRLKERKTTLSKLHKPLEGY